MKSRTQIKIVFAVMVLAACGAPLSRFDYDSASNEERLAWLEPQAKMMNRGFKAGLESTGATRTLAVQAPKIEPGARRIVLAARLTVSGARLNGNLNAMSKSLLAQACPGYVRSPLYHQNVTVSVELQTSSGSRMLGINQSPSVCDRALGRPAGGAQT